MANPFKIVKQTQIDWCWAAVGATINQYFNGPDSLLNAQCEVVHRMTGDDNSCDADPPVSLDISEQLQDVLACLKIGSLQINPLANTVLSFADIQSQINSGMPVCVRITWTGMTNAHFVIVYGWGVASDDSNWLDIADPWFPDSTIPYDQFKNSYQDEGEWTDTFLLSKS